MWLTLALNALLVNTARAEWLSDEQAIMGTDIRVTLWHADKRVAQRAVTAVMSEMRRIESAFSPYIDTSELAQLNNRAIKQPVSLSPELAMLVDRSLYFSRLSNGAFDITFASVGWRYDYRAGKQPGEEETQRLLPAINYRLLNWNQQNQTLHYRHPNVRVDLGGIAKGYAVDQAIEKIRAHGIVHASISAGGDSRLLGDRQGRPWLIGIKNPRMGAQDAREVVLTMPLSDVAVSTSGDYERFFIDEKSGHRVHHILNPLTGRSADQVMSVTILGPRAIDTDALSTSVFVMGPVDGMKLINELPDFDAVIIDRAGQVRYSEGLMEPATKP